MTEPTPCAHIIHTTPPPRSLVRTRGLYECNCPTGIQYLRVISCHMGNEFTVNGIRYATYVQWVLALHWMWVNYLLCRLALLRLCCRVVLLLLTKWCHFRFFWLILLSGFWLLSVTGLGIRMSVITVVHLIYFFIRDIMITEMTIVIINCIIILTMKVSLLRLLPLLLFGGSPEKLTYRI